MDIMLGWALVALIIGCAVVYSVRAAPAGDRPAEPRRRRQRRLPSTLRSVHAVPEREDHPQLPTRHRRDGGKLPPVGSNGSNGEALLDQG